MSKGSGSASRRGDIEDRNGTRIIWGSCGNPIQIRYFRPNAKIGDPCDAVDLFYDDCYNLTNALKVAKAEYVNNLDIRVPDKPVITNSTPASPNASTSPNIEGTIGGDIVKDGDFVEIYDANTDNLLGKGDVASGAFSVTVDLSTYGAGDITVYAKAFNEKFRFHGGSERSLHFIYTLL